jgi:hypothetical protein
MKVHFLRAEGAKCDSPGHRPGFSSAKVTKALKARVFLDLMWAIDVSAFFPHLLRAFSAQETLDGLYPGRCPGLLHIAPLAH